MCPATSAGSLTRDHAARCRVLGRIHRRTMDTPCVLASLGARDPGSGQRYRAQPHRDRRRAVSVRSPRLTLPRSLARLGRTVVGLWIRAKTVDQDERGNAERRAVFVGLWPPLIWLIGDSVDRHARPGRRRLL